MYYILTYQLLNFRWVITNCLKGKVSTIPKCPSRQTVHFELYGKVTFKAKCPLCYIWQNDLHGKVFIWKTVYKANCTARQSVFFDKVYSTANCLFDKMSTLAKCPHDKVYLTSKCLYDKMSLTAKCPSLLIWQSVNHYKVSLCQSVPHGKVSHNSDKAKSSWQSVPRQSNLRQNVWQPK